MILAGGEQAGCGGDTTGLPRAAVPRCECDGSRLDPGQSPAAASGDGHRLPLRRRADHGPPEGGHYTDPRRGNYTDRQTAVRRAVWKTIRPLNPAVSDLMDLIVPPDGAVAYLYRADASQLYVIKGLK